MNDDTLRADFGGGLHRCIFDLVGSLVDVELVCHGEDWSCLFRLSGIKWHRSRDVLGTKVERRKGRGGQGWDISEAGGEWMMRYPTLNYSAEL